MISKVHLARSALVLWVTLFAACSLAPSYHLPEVSVPQAYKETQGNWLPTKPENANMDRGPWWRMYDEREFNSLEERVATANQDLQAALARYEQARAAVGIARADYFPTITGVGSVIRQRESRTIDVTPPPRNPYNLDTVGLDLSYEVDVWGRVRNAVRASESQAKASAADLATMDVSLHAELATDYFSLRGDDASQKVLDETVITYQRALDLTRHRHEGGAAAASDVDQAEVQLENAKTQAADLRLKRAQLEHAIAILIGEPPSSFSLPAKISVVVPVPVMPGIPATLLERRPDIAAAALRVQAANAEIGVARAAYFPDISLTGAVGFESAILSKLLTAPSLFWSLGPSAAVTLFNGGKTMAQNQEARATYDEAVANYRQSVLSAFQDVEDNLVALRQLEQEAVTQAAATAAAERALTQAQDRYTGGIATYLDVVVAQDTALQAELASIDIHTRRLNASVLLIKALGGGWTTASED